MSITATTYYTAPSISDIAALTTRPAFVTLSGFGGAADGGGATYWWDAGSGTTADGVYVIQPVSGPAGRYKRLVNGYQDSVIIGPQAAVDLYSLASLRCIAIGNNALGSAGAGLTASAADNVAIGNYALAENTDAALNVAIGSAAMRYNTTGYWQTAVGAFSMFANTTGYWNVALGFQSLYWNTTGNQNTMLGTFAGFQQVTPDDNTGVGYNALQSIVQSDTNAAVGTNALYRSSSVIATLGSLVGGSGYTDGTYHNVRMDVVSGYPITPALDPLVNWFPNWPVEGGPAVLPRCDITVSGGAVTVCAVVSNAFTALSWSGGTVTGTTTSPHGIGVGASIYVTGASPAAYNGFYTTTTGTAGSTIKYAKVSDPGTATALGKLDGRGFSVGQGTILSAPTSVIGAGSGFTITIATVKEGRVNTALGGGAAAGGPDGILSTAGSLTAVGGFSQYNSAEGEGNTSLGAYSLFNVNNGGFNTAAGLNAGYNLTTGSYNILLGQFVDAPSNTGSRQLNIGNVLFGTDMYNGSTNSATPIAGKIGIGVVPTTHELEINGQGKSATPAASTLDGTLITAAFVGAAWTAYTPTLGAGTGTLTSATAFGRYKRVGKLYYYIVQINIATNGTGANWLTFTLPNSSTPIAPGSGVAVNAGLGNSTCSVRHETGSNVALIFKYDGTYPGGDTTSLYVTGFYEAT